MKTEQKPTRKKYRHYQKHESPRPMRLRHEAQRRLVARCLMLGWSGEKIARRLGVSARSIRYLISTAAFQQFFDTYQAEYFQRVDARLRRMLDTAVTALFRQLKHPDWRCRADAIEKVLKIHGRFLEKLEITGSLEHTGQVRHVHQAQFGLLPDDLMTDEMREHARKLLELSRRGTTGPRPLPARLVAPTNGHSDEASRASD